ncbi:MAG: prolipoprotein diacylglyceryl transferase [Candidatus Eisenbacteria bacterium]|nr:prolipoprotein diacylglyceryl transferase [Candidatus Eisenbacteria bacterium]
MGVLKLIPVLFRIGPFTLYSFGLMAALAFLAGRWVLLRGLERRGIPRTEGEAYTWGALAGGLAGAHIYYLVEHWEEVLTDPLGTIFSGAGLVWYGGLLGGAAVCLAILFIKRHPLGDVADAFGPGLAITYAVGRIGCFLSGDGCYGTPCGLPWCMAFPDGVVPTTVRVHPTPLYETIMTLAIFAGLKRMERRPLPAGSIFWAYVGLASLERFLAGFTRDIPHIFGGLDTVQLLSILGMALALAAGLRLRARGRIV